MASEVTVEVERVQVYRSKDGLKHDTRVQAERHNARAAIATYFDRKLGEPLSDEALGLIIADAQPLVDLLLQAIKPDRAPRKPPERTRIIEAA